MALEASPSAHDRPPRSLNTRGSDPGHLTPGPYRAFDTGGAEILYPLLGLCRYLMEPIPMLYVFIKAFIALSRYHWIL